jgi:hypothetical protein
MQEAIIISFISFCKKKLSYFLNNYTMGFWQTIKDNAFPIMMIVSLLQFIFTIIITVILNRSTQRQLRFDVLRSIDTQWQDLNKIIVSNPQVQEAILDESLKGATQEQMIRMNIVYYKINTFQQIIRAREQGFISKDVAAHLIDGHISFLKQFPREIEIVFASDKGFDKPAMSELKNYWKKTI